MTGDFRDWIGRSLTREDVAAPRLLAEFRATLHPFLFADAHTACPPGFHLCLAGRWDVAEDVLRKPPRDQQGVALQWGEEAPGARLHRIRRCAAVDWW